MFKSYIFCGLCLTAAVADRLPPSIGLMFGSPPKYDDDAEETQRKDDALRDPRRAWQRWHRLRFRISVRMLMVSVLICGLGLRWVVHRARVQREAVAAIRRAGGRAYYDWQVKYTSNPDFDVLRPNPNGIPPGPGWLVNLLGPDYLGTVRFVMLPGTEDADPVMPYIGQLRGLEELYIGPTVPLSDAGVAHLRHLTRLKILHLPHGGRRTISGEGLKHLGGLSRLQRLSLRHLPLTDADLMPLRGLTDLRTLDGLSRGLTDQGMSFLAPLVNLRWLDLRRTRITSAGLTHLRGMPRLRILNLQATGVTDEGLLTLARLPALKSVSLGQTEVTSVGLANYRLARPGTGITR